VLVEKTNKTSFKIKFRSFKSLMALIFRHVIYCSIFVCSLARPQHCLTAAPIAPPTTPNFMVAVKCQMEAPPDQNTLIVLPWMQSSLNAFNWAHFTIEKRWAQWTRQNPCHQQMWKQKCSICSQVDGSALQHEKARLPRRFPELPSGFTRRAKELQSRMFLLRRLVGKRTLKIDFTF